MSSGYPKVIERPIRVIGNYSLAEGYKALVEPDTKRIYGIVGENYKTISHEDAVGMVLDATQSLPEYGTPVVTNTFWRGGSRLHTKVKFPEVQVKITDKDVLNPSVDIYNSYDGGLRYSLLFGAFRLVCSNGLVIGEKVLQVVRKHTSNFNPFYIKEELQKGMEAFSNQKEIWKTWLDKQILVAEAEAQIAKMELNKKETEELNKEIEISSGTVMDQKVVSQWFLFNLVAQLITHNVKSENRRRELSLRMSRVFNS